MHAIITYKPHTKIRRSYQPEHSLCANSICVCSCKTHAIITYKPHTKIRQSYQPEHSLCATCLCVCSCNMHAIITYKPHTKIRRSYQPEHSLCANPIYVCSCKTHATITYLPVIITTNKDTPIISACCVNSICVSSCKTHATSICTCGSCCWAQWESRAPWGTWWAITFLQTSTLYLVSRLQRSAVGVWFGKAVNVCTACALF